MKTAFWIFIVLFTGAIAPSCHSQHRKDYIPDYIAVQYAGSTGWMGIGAGYDILKQHARVGIQYGFVPEEKGGKLHILSNSFFFKPFVLHSAGRVDFNPLDVGVKTSYHFGDQFYLNWPSRFPDGYYWWKSALRIHLATETSLTFKLKNTGRAKSVTTYLELNSSDLYMISYVQNFRSLSIPDIVKAGVGLRVGF